MPDFIPMVFESQYWTTPYRQTSLFFPIQRDEEYCFLQTAKTNVPDPYLCSTDGQDLLIILSPV